MPGVQEEDLLRDIGEIVRPEHEANPHLLQLLAEIFQLGQAAAVPDGEPGPGGGILADQLPVADPHPDQADGPGFYKWNDNVPVSVSLETLPLLWSENWEKPSPLLLYPRCSQKNPCSGRQQGIFFCGGYRRDTRMMTGR